MRNSVLPFFCRSGLMIQKLLLSDSNGDKGISEYQKSNDDSHQKQGRHNCLNEWHAHSGGQRYMEYGVARSKIDGSQQSSS